MALMNKDYATMLGMVGRGDKHHDIAAWFGENQARVAEVIAGKMGKFEAADKATLPPKGAPGVKGQRLLAHVEKALAALDDGDAKAAKEALEAGVKRWNLHE
ncbi:hypothetical protein GCM10010869_28290 [Mesorhizobium tianshanense]|uniref:Uncharacterized protein n=1 Tax=Mesorhizobium tianshanense TaxID=39844 RepID=A0A562MN16_9HYPH|nr:hypothetical protein [Mesorhizobium tianshanense]TWI21208.1 hypothetical protein IQ26_06885 [Mesorhizobium tianshanense]GLS37236.1 hypothetical protein GCM10010869_28290 [Mesorhizobium tianshanense]